ncbi:MAG: GerMN domain-containing protein [Patescibacteria group bacterium]
MSNKLLVILILAVLGIIGILAFALINQGEEKTDGQNQEQATTTLLVYFNNSNLDPEFSCNKVFPVERIVVRTQSPARKALELLFEGPTQSEKEQGFLTSINTGVEIQSLTIENKVAKADFNEQLEFQVGGSCRVSAIRAQITETLKQFPTVDSVIISIDGRTEDILQP